MIPGEATAHVDARFLPGLEDEMLATIDELLGDRVTREFVTRDIALETSFDGPSIDAMAAALRAEDPYARAVPYTLSGGTDAKAFSTLGIRCYGFAPAAAAAHAGLRRPVPRRRRAGADRRPAVRGPGARPLPALGVSRRDQRRPASSDREPPSGASAHSPAGRAQPSGGVGSSRTVKPAGVRQLHPS